MHIVFIIAVVLLSTMWKNLLLVVGCAPLVLGLGGNFTNTCSHLSYVDAIYSGLSAQCLKVNGSLQQSTLDLNECYGVQNGSLVFSPG